MRALVLAAAIVVLPGTALPCDEWYPDRWEIDPAEVGVDLDPPGAARLAGLEVRRGVQPLFDTEVADSCGDGGGRRGGELWVHLHVPTDDRTEPHEIGYRIELAGSDLPRGHGRDSWVTMPWHNSIRLTWDERDDDDLLDFTMRITPLDRAGNEGPTLEVPVRDEGIGCSTAGGSAGAMPLLVVGIALLAGCLRSTRHPR